METKIKAYILEIDETGELTGRSLWDDNCELLDVMKNGDALRVKSSYFMFPEIAVRIPDNMDWGVVDGMRFNFRTWLNDDIVVKLLNNKRQ